MKRRQFLAASLAATLTSALQAEAQATAATPAKGKPREFYSLRKYTLESGPGVAITDAYFANALIPALNRMGIGPVGAMRLSYGPETPTTYLLLPSTSLETLVMVDLNLAQDAVFMKAAAPFWSAPANQAPFLRCESSIMIAFEGFPSLAIPKAFAAKGKRIFHMRSYDSPTNATHVRKIEMFHSGEFEFFRKAGCESVFYGDTLIGPRLPSLTYMLTFEDQAALDAGWARFNADSDWKVLRTQPRYSSEAIVSNVSNLVLTPAPYSQI